MTYIDKQGLIDRGWERQLVQLTDKTNKPATTIDDTIVARHVGDAESTINSYLGKRYTLPLNSVPDVLTKVAADLAVYFLHGAAVDKESPIAQAYRDAVKWLENVSKGLVTIEGADAPLAPAGDGQVQFSGPDRMFTRDRLSSL